MGCNASSTNSPRSEEGDIEDKKVEKEDAVKSNGHGEKGGDDRNGKAGGSRRVRVVSPADDKGDAKEKARKESLAVDVRDFSRQRPKTGEEGAFEMDDDGEIGDGRLGLTSKEDLAEMIKGLQGGKRLFEDPDFPAEQASLFFSKRTKEELDQFTWKRPHELVAEPSIYVDGTSRKDVIQGILGDCWLLSTCAAIAKREDLLHKVMTPDQALYGPGYTGMVKIRIWRYGHWQSVYIDDRIPQRNGKYVYARCQDSTEFWVALIEKAMAKLHGSYEAIEGGMPIEAMVDLTGGLAERYELKDPDMHKTLYRYLRRSFASQAFITCSRKGDWRQAHKADQNGLVQGHAYTITGLYRVDAEKLGRVHLIRVRNPWGDKNEWTGAWSDNHSNWRLVPEKTKKAMGLHKQFDGEFWMEFYSDFCREFEEVSICTLGPDFNHDGTVDRPSAVQVIFGEWALGKSAGGCRNDLRRFATNPQFLLHVHEPDHHEDRKEDSNHNLQDPKCEVIISLAQEHRRSQRHKKVKLLQIGFCLYPANDNGTRLREHDFMYQYDAGTSGPYINYREVFARFELTPGPYVIIPATFEADAPSRFMIRVYSEGKFSLKQLKQAQ